MVLPGVEVILYQAFFRCRNVETFIMSDTVRRIKNNVFEGCGKLKFVRLSKNLEYIGHYAFWGCSSLTSIFIPESCTEIGNRAFDGCLKLIMLCVPRHTSLNYSVIKRTALFEASPFETNEYGIYDDDVDDEVNEWIKNFNQDEEFALHRECASIEPPSENNIYEIIKQQGLPSIQVKNENSVKYHTVFVEHCFPQHEICNIYMYRKFFGNLAFFYITEIIIWVSLLIVVNDWISHEYLTKITLWFLEYIVVDANLVDPMTLHIFRIVVSRKSNETWDVHLSKSRKI